MGKIYNKLVRDNIPDVIRDQGKKAMVRTLNSKEYSEALKKKLLEEVQEYLKSGNPEELADVQEVLYWLIEDQNFTDGEHCKNVIKKFKEYGGFEKKIFLISVEDK